MYCIAANRAEVTPRKVAHCATGCGLVVSPGDGEGSGSGEGDGDGDGAGGKVASRNPVVRAITSLERFVDKQTS